MRFRLTTDEHLGGGADARIFLRHLFEDTNRTLDTDDPVCGVIGLGDRGLKHAITKEEIEENTSIYGCAASTLSSDIPLWLRNGNHETDPFRRLEIIEKKTKRVFNMETHSVDVGPASFLFVNAETLSANNKGREASSLRISRAELDAYRQEKQRIGNKPTIEFSHVTLNDAQQAVTDWKLRKHKGDADYEHYRDHLFTPFNSCYTNWQELDDIRKQTSHPVVALSGHMHDPILTGERSLTLPSFGIKNGERKKAIFTELHVKPEAVALSVKSIDMDGNISEMPFSLSGQPCVSGLEFSYSR